MERNEYYANLARAKEDIEHHGIKGMHWGDRKYQNEDGSLTPAGRARYGYGEGRNAFSAKATANRLASKVYSLNEKTYSKGKSAQARTMASMNRAAKEEFLSKANKAQAEANKKKNEALDSKLRKMQDTMPRKERLKAVDPELAKNKQTKRVAMDYHRLNELEFRAKYATTKKTFSKRYAKTDADTYSAGKKKALRAVAISAMIPAHDVYIGNGKTLNVGGAKNALKYASKDIAYSELVTRIGYNNAENTYKDKMSVENRERIRRNS